MLDLRIYERNIVHGVIAKATPPPVRSRINAVVTNYVETPSCEIKS